MSSSRGSGPLWGSKGNAVTRRPHLDSTPERRCIMARHGLTIGILLALLSGLLWTATVRAHSENLADYDLKTLALVVNRDSSDITLIDTATDTIIKRIPLEIGRASCRERVERSDGEI